MLMHNRDDGHRMLYMYLYLMFVHSRVGIGAARMKTLFLLHVHTSVYVCIT